jgi:hypothetical protein
MQMEVVSPMIQRIQENVSGVLKIRVGCAQATAGCGGVDERHNATAPAAAGDGQKAAPDATQQLPPRCPYVQKVKERICPDPSRVTCLDCATPSRESHQVFVRHFG